MCSELARSLRLAPLPYTSELPSLHSFGLVTPSEPPSYTFVSYTCVVRLRTGRIQLTDTVDGCKLPYTFGASVVTLRPRSVSLQTPSEAPRYTFVSYTCVSSGRSAPCFQGRDLRTRIFFWDLEEHASFSVNIRSRTRGRDASRAGLARVSTKSLSPRCILWDS